MCNFWYDVNKICSSMHEKYYDICSYSVTMSLCVNYSR